MLENPAVGAVTRFGPFLPRVFSVEALGAQIVVIARAQLRVAFGVLRRGCPYRLR
jgi:hypothetical protein